MKPDEAASTTMAEFGFRCIGAFGRIFVDSDADARRAVSAEWR
jgi:hypothetical protein